jgi:hypothetical protein
MLVKPSHVFCQLPSILSFHVCVVCTCGVASKADEAYKFRGANEPTAEIDLGEEGVFDVAFRLK